MFRTAEELLIEEAIDNVQKRMREAKKELDRLRELLRDLRTGGDLWMFEMTKQMIRKAWYDFKKEWKEIWEDDKEDNKV